MEFKFEFLCFNLSLDIKNIVLYMSLILLHLVKIQYIQLIYLVSNIWNVIIECYGLIEIQYLRGRRKEWTSLIHSPGACNSQTARAKASSWEHNPGLLRLMVGTWLLETSPLLPRVSISWKLELGVQPCYSDIGILTARLNAHPLWDKICVCYLNAPPYVYLFPAVYV